jgi:integral membrane protein
MSPRRLFRIFALAEFITWALLITGLILRGLGVDPVVTVITGGIHGFVFLCYGVVTVFVWVNQRWKFFVGFVGLITTIVPFATLPFELIIDKKGLLAGGWRLAPGAHTPRNWVEHIQAWILRHIALSIVIGVLGVVAVFTVLLILGPPVPREN